jgi:hypothetical protein
MRYQKYLKKASAMKHLMMKKGPMMKSLTIEQTADYLEAATIVSTVNAGWVIMHQGINGFGARFMMMTDMFEATAVSEAT